MAKKRRTSVSNNESSAVSGNASRVTVAIDQDTSDRYLCSEWTMNVAAKVVLIIFGVLVGHFITISLHPNGNWATKLWSLSHDNVNTSQEATLSRIEKVLLQAPETNNLIEASSLLQSTSKLQLVGRQEAWWMILKGMEQLQLERFFDALDFCNKGLNQLSKVSDAQGTSLEKRAFFCLASSYQKLNLTEAAIDSYISSIHFPYNSSDLFERTIHEQSVLPLTHLYLLPTVNKPQRVVDLIVQQINDRHISPRWLQSDPRGPLCCVYSNAVSLMENSSSGRDKCAINSLNHTFYLQLEQQKIINDALQTIEQYPDEVEAHKQAAISFLRLGSPVRSLSAVKVALVLQPDNLASLLLCGEAAEQQADFDEASKCYHAAYDEIKSRPADSDDYDLSVARTQVFRGLMSWARVLIRKNEFPQAYLVLLRCQLLHGYSHELASMIDIAKTKMGFGSSSVEYSSGDGLENLTTIFSQSVDAIENVSVHPEAVLTSSAIHTGISDSSDSTHQPGIPSEVGTKDSTSSASGSGSDSAVEIPPEVEDVVDHIATISADSTLEEQSQTSECESNSPHDTTHLVTEIESTTSTGAIESVPQESNPNTEEVVPAVQLEATDSATSVDGTEISTVSVSESESESVQGFESNLEVVDPVTAIDASVLIFEEGLQENDPLSSPPVDSSVSAVEERKAVIESEEKETVAQDSESQSELVMPTLELETTISFHEIGVPSSSERVLESEVDLQQIEIEGQIESKETNIPSTILINDESSIPSEDNSVAVTVTEGTAANDITATDVLQPESSNQTEPVIQPLELEVTSSDSVSTNGTMGAQEPVEEITIGIESTVLGTDDVVSADISSSNTTHQQGEKNYNDSSLSLDSSTLNIAVETAVPNPISDQNDSLRSQETSNSSSTPSTDKAVEDTVKPLQISAEDAARIRIASPLMKMADAYLSQGQYDMAIKQLTKALKKAPSYADAYFLRAKLYEVKGDYERSTADYLKIFSDLDPKNRTVFSTLLSVAMKYSYAGKYSESLPILETIIKNVNEVFTFPRDTEVFTTISTSLAVAHAKLNNSNDAIKALNAAEPALTSLAAANLSDDRDLVEIDSLISQRTQLYSQLYESTGQIVKAEEALRKTHEQKAISWNDLGEFYHRHKMYMKAIDSFQHHLNELNSTSTSGGGSSGRKGLFSSYSAANNDKQMAVTHKRIGSAYQSILLDSDCSQSNSSDCSVNNTETVDLIDSHFSKAMQLGLDDRDIRRFFALYKARSIDPNEIVSLNDTDSLNTTSHEVNSNDNVVEGILQSHDVNDTTETTPSLSAQNPSDSVQQLSPAITHRRRSSQHRWVIRQLVNESVPTISSLQKLTRPPLVDVNSILQMGSVSSVPANIRDALSALETPVQAAAHNLESTKVRSPQTGPETVKPSMKMGGMGNAPLTPPVAASGARASRSDSAPLTAFEQQLLAQEELQEQEEQMEQKAREAMSIGGNGDHTDLSDVVAALMRQVND